MKIKLISYNGYYLGISEETEIKDGDLCLHPNNKTIGKIQIALAIAVFKETSEGSYVEDCNKIICASPELNLDVPALPDFKQFENE